MSTPHTHTHTCTQPHTRFGDNAWAAKKEAEHLYRQYKALISESRDTAALALQASEYAQWLQLAGMRQESAAALRKAKEWVQGRS
jgi:phage gp45-like